MKILSYKVTVEAVVERTEKSGKEWARLRDDDPAYGYTPEIEKTFQRSTAIYEQRVEQLDMAQLVAVVNKLHLG